MPITPFAKKPMSSSMSLPFGWEEKESNSQPGRVYYINLTNGTRQWDKPTLDADKIENDAIQALHILIKYKDCVHPTNYKTKNEITITKNEAIDKINSIKKRLLTELRFKNTEAMEKLFRQIAFEESDSSTYIKNGDLGLFTKGQLEKTFEDASYKLKVDCLSDPVDTPTGIHLIMRLK